jgi:hypothetical protein
MVLLGVHSGLAKRCERVPAGKGKAKAAEEAPLMNMMAYEPLAFDLSDAHEAARVWRFNCGPGALCAALAVSPKQIRPHLMEFEAKGYTNPTMMYSILRGLGVRWSNRGLLWPDSGLVRIQWHGPWMDDGVPPQARYRHSHWVAGRNGPNSDYQIFDVNAVGHGGWIDKYLWASWLVPWLLEQCEPRSNGAWSITHSLELNGDDCLRANQRLMGSQAAPC